MKARYSFVSNSSSSSFIIALDNEPKTIEELRTTLFGNQSKPDDILEFDYWNDEERITLEQVSKYIYNNILEPTDQSLERIFQNRYSIYSSSYNDDPNFADLLCFATDQDLFAERMSFLDKSMAKQKSLQENFDYSDDWDSRRNTNNHIKQVQKKQWDTLLNYYNPKLAKLDIDLFKKTYSNKYIYMIEIRDNTPFEATLESGIAFQNIPYIHTSNH